VILALAFRQLLRSFNRSPQAADAENFTLQGWGGIMEPSGIVPPPFLTISIEGVLAMPLFEIETDSHIIITWAESEDTAKDVVLDTYPSDEVLRLTKRPRDTWVISKGALGLTNTTLDPCTVARDCLSRSAGDKVNAIRLYRMETGSDLEHARKAIESNMVMGW
jgi:hypothetical protein